MYNQIDENKRNTILLMAFFAVVITVLSWFLGEYMIGYGPGGLFLGGIFAIAYGLISYFFSSDIVLAISGAREVKK